VWASWTLGVEMVFYLIFPIVFRYVNNWWKSSIFFFVSFLPAVFYAKVLNYLSIPDAIRVSFFRTSFFRQLPIFAFGMLIFFVYERFIQGKLSKRLWARIWAYVFVVAAVIGYDALISGRLPLLLGDFYIQGVFYGLLLLGLSIAPLRVIVNPLTRFYGEISYSVYLNHPTLVAALVPAYRAIYALHLPVAFHYAACLSLTLVLLTALSYITFRVIEKPGMLMGRRLIKRIAV
jgi:peptidoglycan/LPS O-acetylase OafA/YrhL